MTLQIVAEGRVVIRAPMHTPLEEIERFFQGRIPWIRRKMEEGQGRENARFPARSFAPGERFLYLGEVYPLAVDPAPDGHRGLAFRDGTFLLPGERFVTARDCFIAWYREEARSVLREAVTRWGEKLNLSPGKVRITGARRRYGSCSSRNALSFSWRLVMAPPAIVDYVVVHELMHMIHKNHAPAFWRSVERVLPDLQVRRRWLKEHSHLLLL